MLIFFSYTGLFHQWSLVPRLLHLPLIWWLADASDLSSRCVLFSFSLSLSLGFLSLYLFRRITAICLRTMGHGVMGMHHGWQAVCGANTLISPVSWELPSMVSATHLEGKNMIKSKVHGWHCWCPSGLGSKHLTWESHHKLPGVLFDLKSDSFWLDVWN